MIAKATYLSKYLIHNINTSKKKIYKIIIGYCEIWSNIKKLEDNIATPSRITKRPETYLKYNLPIRPLFITPTGKNYEKCHINRSLHIVRSVLHSPRLGYRWHQSIIPLNPRHWLHPYWFRQQSGQFLWPQCLPPMLLRPQGYGFLRFLSV